MHISLSADLGPDANLKVSDFEEFASSLSAALTKDPTITHSATPVGVAVRSLLATPEVIDFMVRVSRADVFGAEAAADFAGSTRELHLLRAYKLLKYCYNLPCGQLLSILSSILDAFTAKAKADPVAKALTGLVDRVQDDPELGPLFVKRLVLSHVTDSGEKTKTLDQKYEDNAEHLLHNDPHGLYPTSIYRQCHGHVSSSEDSKVIEGVMGTTITTTIEIVRNVLQPEQPHLRAVYKPLGRCVAVVDERVDGIYGDDLNRYFEANGIELHKLVYRCMEVDKDISTVEQILVDLKSRRVSRNEPVLVVGGGVMSDVGGFACALYHRNTPYVMLCTSIVSGIDAGPSPRTCCDGLGYKNVFGAYHPPILTLTDRQFFRSLHPGWVRHGIAEIIKMAVTTDLSLFCDVERAGTALVDTCFGVEAEPGSEIDELSDQIIAKAMDGYVRAEYGNLWETHQCRPHAYGHTWSPGFELQAGLLHGHAISIGMGYGAYLSFLNGWITEEEMHRILRVFSNLGLSLTHSILENVNSIWSAQVKMTEKRGGNLCAPLPRGGIGKCGYLNDMSRPNLEKTLKDYQELVSSYPRGGLGIEPHCHDVGLEDPSTVKQHADNAVAKDDPKPVAVENGQAATTDGAAPNGTPATNGTTTEAANIDTYNEWLVTKQRERNTSDDKEETSSTLGTKLSMVIPADVAEPPKFPHESLFHAGAESYASDMTTLCSDDYITIAQLTEEAGLFAPCMVGKLEGQFLKMMTQIKGAQSVLDVGTFTGYSALAFADGGAKQVLTIEGDAKTADVAREVFKRAKNGSNVQLEEGDAQEIVMRLKEEGAKFDIVFLDADKVNYKLYYEQGLEMLAEGGVLMADNALCSLVYAEDDPARKALHEFAQFVRRDDRVEQVMLTVREGILVVQKKA